MVLGEMETSGSLNQIRHLSVEWHRRYALFLNTHFYHNEFVIHFVGNYLSIRDSMIGRRQS